MRNAEIRDLFAYLYWIRDRVLTAAQEAGSDALRGTRPGASGDLRAILVHELDVESGWRARLRGDEEIDLDPADFPTLDSIAEHWQRDEVDMRRWLASLTDEALAAPPPHETGQSFPFWYYLVHVVSHGIQELEEAVALLGPSGHSPQNLGFLDYADTTIDPAQGGRMAGRDDPGLRAMAQEALTIGDTVSAVIFVVAPGSSDLELAAAAGLEGPPLDALVAAVRNPAHPVARALSDAGPSFDVRPTAPGGPALRSHLPLRPSAGKATTALGVLALAHESPMSEANRRQLEALAGRATAAIVV